MTDQNDALLAPSSPEKLLSLAGIAANQAAGKAVFGDYQARKANNTNRRQAADLALFEQFLTDSGAKTEGLASDPQAWDGITWGLVAAFAAWQLRAGYAIGSINARLSTVKVYAKLAALAGAIQPGELALIRSVAGYAHKEIKNVDEKREAAGLDTRKGAKKAAAVVLSLAQARKLKAQPETPQGRRDRLALCLMLDLGLRVGELASLTVDNFDLGSKTFTFYREKVNKIQTMDLKNGAWLAVKAWFESGDAPAIGSLWRSSRKSKTGQLQGSGWSVRAINARIADLGAEIGIPGLSPHDLRHYWATCAARNHTPMDRLQDAGGWNSLAMPGRYIEAAKIANEGVSLGDE